MREIYFQEDDDDMTNPESFFETDEEYDEWDQSMREVRKCQQCEELADALEMLLCSPGGPTGTPSWDSTQKAYDALRKYRGEA